MILAPQVIQSNVQRSKDVVQHEVVPQTVQPAAQPVAQLAVQRK
ncbi:MAG TPA: hypothetical protein VGF75_07865 [Candidatus Saccharimonadales bacterium]